jgi:hypothetical protein
VTAFAGTSGTTVSANNKLVDAADSRLTNTRTPTAGVITDSMVNASAAIALTKLAAPFNTTPTVGSFLQYGAGGWTTVAAPSVTLINATTLLKEATTSSGIDGGTSVIDFGAVVRGIGVPNGPKWTVITDPANNLASGLFTDGKIKLDAGTYVFNASAPAFEVGCHFISIYQYSTSGAYKAAMIGTDEVSPVGGGVQTRSHVSCVLTIATGDYITLVHQCEFAQLTNGLGVHSTGRENSRFALMEIRRIE